MGIFLCPHVMSAIVAMNAKHRPMYHSIHNISVEYILEITQFLLIKFNDCLSGDEMILVTIFDFFICFCAEWDYSLDDFIYM